MQIFTLASGSTGNCTLISDQGSTLLIDAGISARRITRALDSLGFSVDSLSGILITHEHSDHICGLNTLIKHHDITIMAPRTVANHLRYCIAGVDDYIKELPVGQEESIGGLGVMPFHTPHDTPESVGYRITGSSVFGFCTDFGHVTDEVLDSLRGADAAIVEANHDVEILKAGPYPFPLKRRILSDNGHLSNDCCGALALELCKSGTRSVILGHLSRENNTPAQAMETVSAILQREGISPGRDICLGVAPEKEFLHLNIRESAIC